jgi:hypothetical protein
VTEIIQCIHDRPVQPHRFRFETGQIGAVIIGCIELDSLFPPVALLFSFVLPSLTSVMLLFFSD